ncbi:MAG: hypothetical protein KGZ81_13510 [Flavobacteriales bacterium]|nr:hypothetical protein [Flavobacteriales bacterium]
MKTTITISIEQNNETLNVSVADFKSQPLTEEPTASSDLEKKIQEVLAQVLEKAQNSTV